MDNIGYRGLEKAAPFPADAYFELHIEQGPILEREAKPIGIVTGAQAQVWYDAVVTGQDAHAGTTPPSSRKPFASRPGSSPVVWMRHFDCVTAPIIAG